jgi:predicted ATP-grasp superfamily ATP-dependent carboligase
MAESGRGHVLIAGLTTRALAVSAVRAGYRVTAVDGFGDLDLRAVAEVIALRPEEGKRYGPLAAAAAGDAVPANLAAYTSNLENYPDAVARLSIGRELLGNSAQLLRPVRNPIELMRLLRREGFDTPDTRATPMVPRARKVWLLKPRRSGGGHGITVWRAGVPVARSRYLQERIAGIPGSIAFVADGERASVLGISRQLVGEARFGAQGFRYCGSLLGPPATPVLPHQREVSATVTAMADAVTREFRLVGLNGLDFIACDGIPYPVEVNPRCSASMELIERASAVSLFEVHTRACRGILPADPVTEAGVHGKAIVFARRDVSMGDTRRWLQQEWLADVPHPGERISQGRPICTVFASGADAGACRRLLLRRAATVYRMAATHRRRAA